MTYPNFQLKNLSLNFQLKNLTECDFSNQDLTGADFRNSILFGADFTNSKIEKCNFNGALLREAKFQNTGFILSEVRFFIKYFDSKYYQDILVLAKTDEKAIEKARIRAYFEQDWAKIDTEEEEKELAKELGLEKVPNETISINILKRYND